MAIKLTTVELFYCVASGPPDYHQPPGTNWWKGPVRCRTCNEPIHHARYFLDATGAPRDWDTAHYWIRYEFVISEWP